MSMALSVSSARYRPGEPEFTPYERTAIRFVARLGGQTYDFKGALQQGQLTGTLHPEGGSETVGHFVLSFIE